MVNKITKMNNVVNSQHFHLHQNLCQLLFMVYLKEMGVLNTDIF